MKIEFDDDFWYDKKDDKSRVFQVFPSVFGDDRGTFTEIWKCETTTIPENMKEELDVYLFRKRDKKKS